jgi:hypothetical protein
MSKNRFNLIVFLICLWGVITIINIFLKAQDSQSYRNDRFDKCLDAVNQAVPDPNDLQGRSDFLRNCYE